MRSFVALPLPEAQREPLLALQAAIPVGRAMPEETLHLTLAFLDEVEAPVLEEVHLGLDGRRLPACVLEPVGLLTLGGGAGRLLALEIAPVPALLALREAVARAVRGAGLTMPRDRFRPHVTIRRFNRGLGPADEARLGAALAGGGLPAVPAATAVSLAVYRSDLGAGGARHTVLWSYPLIP